MSLSSLIVQREVASMRQVEEALARQVIYGGDLVTNLLEVARVDENVLTGLLAESMRLAPAPAGELPRASDEVRSLVPREIALQRTVVPLEVQVDGKLVLAVAEPLPADLAEQLRFALGMSLEQRAAPAVRVHQALARSYGIPLDRRMLRLISRLGGDAPELGSTPPPLGFSPIASDPPIASPARERTGSTTTATVVGRLVPKAPGHRITNAGFPAAPPVPPVAPAPAAGSSVVAAPAAVSPVASPPAPAVSPAPPVVPVSPAPPPTQQSSTGEVRGHLLQRAVSMAPRPMRRRRGPITLDLARSEADDAADRDALLDLFFDFSQQFFDYSALFLVHGDIAEGRDAFGGGASRERVLGIGVPLDMPSLLSSVREKRLSVIAKPPGDGLDAVLLTDLNRARDSEMAIVPLVVRTRAVALLIGDCGDAGIDRESVQQVVSFSGIVGKAFERIIVRRKLDGFIAGGREGAAGRVSSSMVPPKSAAAPASVPPRATPSAPPVASKLPSLSTTLASASSPAFSRPAQSSPPVPFVPRRAAAPRAPASTSGLPPPAANVAVVRRISGPPIPREEPDTPGVVHAVVRTSVPPVAPRAPSPSRSSPELEIVDLDVAEPDEASAAALFDELGWEGGDGPGTRSDAGLPPSSAVAVAAHLPPAPVGPVKDLPSIIVDDLDADLVAMVDRLASGEVDETAEGELLRQGERAMRAIMSRFPGPVSFSRARIATANNPPRASDCGPILRLVARERRVALPFVLDRLTAPDADVRGWAAHLIIELPYVDAIPRLLPCLRDVDASVSASAALALAAIARSAPEPVRDALFSLAHGVTPADRAGAIAAMARLRDATFVPELVRALGDHDDAVVTLAHTALVQVTLQDLGTDARLWLRWWEQNSGKHRIEWLIDALGHDVTELRKSAAEELRALTKEYFGYAGDLPPRDRDRAQQRYRDWWEMEGRSRFRRE
ncbi:MAG TPA: hypothetical protein VK762_27875 [Polyangiaceae bacterium]|jgi:hypothetical protein|nr:hypothetical protein [Polyangiaceae bacterium]